MSQAMQFSLFAERRDDESTLFEGFRKDLQVPGLTRIEAQKFCQRADALGADGRLLQQLKQIVNRG